MMTDHKDVWDALWAVQEQIGPIFKDSKVSFGTTNYSYVKLEAIMEKVNPILRANGLLLTQPLDNLGVVPAITTTLLHMSSRTLIERTTPLVLAKNDPQAMGSAITYLRRYSLGSLLQLEIEDDDDGRKATFSKDELKAQAKPVTPLKEVKNPDDLIDDTQFMELVFACSKTGVDKESAKLYWQEVRNALGLERGMFDPKTKTWDGTHNITKADVPLMYDILEKYVIKAKEGK